MKRYSKSILIIGLLVTSVWSQNHSNGTLLTKSEIKSLTQRAKDQLHKNPDSTIIIAEEILSFYDNNSGREQEYVEVLSLIGYAYNFKLQYHKSIPYFMSALKLVSNNVDPKTILYTYMNLGYAYYYISEIDSALKYFVIAKQLKAVKEKISDFYLILSILGGVYYKKRDFDISLKYHFEALDVLVSYNLDNKLVETYYSIGSVYNALSEYDKAIEYYLKAKSLIINEREIINSMILHAMGIVYEELRNYKKALSLNITSLFNLNNNNDLNIKISCLNSIGSIYHKIGKLDSALIYIKKAKDLSENYFDPQIVAITYNNLGNILAANGNYTEAISNHKKAYNLSEKSKDKWRMARVLIDLGRIYVEKGNLLKAESCLNNGEEISQIIGAKNLLLDSYSGLLDISFRRRRFADAFKYQRLFIALQDSIQIEKSMRIADMQLRYETDKREKENEILRRNNAIQELQIQKQTLVQTVQLLFLMIFIVLFGLLLYRYRMKNKHNKSLQQRIDETIERHREQQQIIIHQAGLTSLGELAASIIHDILQPIQNIRLTAESAALQVSEKPIKGTKILYLMDEIKEDVFRAERIVNHIKIFARKDKQTNLDKFEVNESIRDAILVTRRQFKSQKIRVEANLAENLPVLKGNHYNFEQIMINLLHNARDAIYQKRTLKAQMPGEIKIETSISEREVKVSLCDNGIGIPDKIKVNIFKPFFTTKSAGIGTGLGLVIVNKMIKEIGGRIEYQSIQDEGTTVVISVPVNIQPDQTERMYLESNKSTYCR